MSRFQLGQRVVITGTAVKTKRYAHNASRTTIGYEEGGLPTRWNYPKRVTFDSGVIVGKRTVQDGTAYWDPDGNYYRPERGTAREVWLVAVDMRMKPVMCFDHQVQATD